MVRKGVMATLECRMYSAPEMWAYLGVKNNAKAKEKLNRYDVVYFLNGTGGNASFNITAIHDPFRLYCVFDMGFNPNLDFRKLRNYLFFLLGDEEYCWLPDEAMEAYMRSNGYPISRQTIASYREKLESLGYIHGGDFIYYRVYRDENDCQRHQQIEKEEYSRAWHLYWDKRNNEGWDSEAAFAYMYSSFGGVPRKQAAPEKNALHLEELNYLLDLVSTSIMKEVSV